MGKSVERKKRIWGGEEWYGGGGLEEIGGAVGRGNCKKKKNRKNRKEDEVLKSEKWKNDGKKREQKIGEGYK